MPASGFCHHDGKNHLITGILLHRLAKALGHSSYIAHKHGHTKTIHD